MTFPLSEECSNRLSYRPKTPSRNLEHLKSDRKTLVQAWPPVGGRVTLPIRQGKDLGVERRLVSLCSMLPRKEVIQPQLPLQLPCYDFVPVTNPTLDGSLPLGLGHRLQVLPASMT